MSEEKCVHCGWRFVQHRETAPHYCPDVMANTITWLETEFCAVDIQPAVKVALCTLSLESPAMCRALAVILIDDKTATNACRGFLPNEQDVYRSADEQVMNCPYRKICEVNV
jgi:hypothetical protein